MFNHQEIFQTLYKHTVVTLTQTHFVSGGEMDGGMDGCIGGWIDGTGDSWIIHT